MKRKIIFHPLMMPRSPSRIQTLPSPRLTADGNRHGCATLIASGPIGRAFHPLAGRESHSRALEDHRTYLPRRVRMVAISSARPLYVCGQLRWDATAFQKGLGMRFIPCRIQSARALRTHRDHQRRSAFPTCHLKTRLISPTKFRHIARGVDCEAAISMRCLIGSCRSKEVASLPIRGGAWRQGSGRKAIAANAVKDPTQRQSATNCARRSSEQLTLAAIAAI